AEPFDLTCGRALFQESFGGWKPPLPQRITAFSPSALIARLRARLQFPLVSCSARCPRQEQFLPKELVRQKFFRAQVRSVKPVRKPDCVARCFATAPEDRPSD